MGTWGFIILLCWIYLHLKISKVKSFKNKKQKHTLVWLFLPSSSPAFLHPFSARCLRVAFLCSLLILPSPSLCTPIWFLALLLLRKWKKNLPPAFTYLTLTDKFSSAYSWLCSGTWYSIKSLLNAPFLWIQKWYSGFPPTSLAIASLFFYCDIKR